MDLYLDRLELVDFKNYEQASLRLSPRFNCFAGLNGAGKTNLLDSIYYLSTCKSFLNPSDQQNIRHDRPFFVIHGTFQVKGSTEDIYCGFIKGQRKQFKRNQKEYDRLAEHIGFLPVVLISPEDGNLVTGGSEIRRKFVDSVISQSDPHYLTVLLDYNKALAQRNSLLKEFNRSGKFDSLSLEIWNERMIPSGQEIYEKRLAFIRELVPFFRDSYRTITDHKEEPSLSYNSQLHDNDLNILFSQSLSADRSAQFTTQGIHKDDLVFILDNHPVKKFGSQGQQKSFLLSLRLAQYQYLKEKKGITPLMLLDDIYDKLDDKRTEAMLGLLAGPGFGQVFISDTQVERNSKWMNKLNVPFRLFSLSDEGIVLYEEKE